MNGWDDYDEDDYEDRPPNCPDCNDTGKVVAMDGESEWMGCDYVPCHCLEATKWIGRLGPNQPIY